MSALACSLMGATTNRPLAKPDGRPVVRLSPRVRLHYIHRLGVMYAIIERGDMTIMTPLYWRTP